MYSAIIERRLIPACSCRVAGLWRGGINCVAAGCSPARLPRKPALAQYYRVSPLTCLVTLGFLTSYNASLRKSKGFLDSWVPLCYPLKHKCHWLIESQFSKMLTLSYPVEFSILFRKINLLPSLSNNVMHAVLYQIAQLGVRWYRRWIFSCAVSL